MNEPMIKMEHITKVFAVVVANNDVNLSVNKGEVLALLGENGAGKSTIMKILYGIYGATSGAIYINGKEVDIRSPKDAMSYGISMIQQHFTLVQAHSVTENIILSSSKGKIDYKAKEKEIQELSDKYNFNIKADSLVKDLTVGEQQKVEILKALYMNAEILIMDEPTAVLTPQEIDTLMEFVKNYVNEGNTAIFITHKMKEVMEVANTIVVMRNGVVSGIVNKNETNETELARMMIGHDLESIAAPGTKDFSREKIRLKVDNVSVMPKGQAPLLSDISFEIHAGEVLGFAGVSGNGQQELCEAIYGYTNPDKGSIYLDGEDITRLKINDRIKRGMGYVASDRYKYAMVADMTLSENMMLKSSQTKRFVKNGLIPWKVVDQYTENAIEKYNIKAPGHAATAGSLSGGNQQKLVLAREVDMGDSLIIFDQPTRGLDLGAVNHIHKTIVEEKKKGKSILLVSTELSEIFSLSDRIAVLFQGRIMGIFKNGELSTQQIGLLMAGIKISEGGEEHEDKTEC